MKKLFNLLGIFAIGSGLFLTSCDATDDLLDTVAEPTITVIGVDTTMLNIGDSIMFVASATSATDLTGFTALSNSVGATIKNSPFTVPAGSTSKSFDVWVKVGSMATVGEIIAISFKVENSSKFATAVKYIKVGGLPLSAETAFTWERIGGTAATGLEMFGLTWNENTSTSAVIKKGADKFVELAAGTWTSITTATALKAAIDAGTDMTQWTGVSVSATGTYDKVLGTKKGTEYFLIHVTNASVSVVTAGTKVTITGKYKK